MERMLLMRIGRVLSGFLQKSFRSSVFFKTFTLFLIAAIIPAVCIGVLSIKHSSNNIIRHMDDSIGAVLDIRLRSIEQQFYIAEYACNQILISNEIRNLITNYGDPYGRFRYGSSDIRRFDYYRLLNNTIIGNAPLIESIYLFSGNGDSVLCGSRFSKRDFYDQDILNISFDKNEYVTITNPRAVTDLKDVTTRVISYVKGMDLFPSMDKLYVVVNMKYDILFSGLEIPDMKYPYEFFVVDGASNVVFNNNTLDIEPGNINIESIPLGTGSIIQNINGTDYYIQGRILTEQDYTLIFAQKYADIVQTFSLFNKVLVSALEVIIALSFIAACSFSVYVYKPLDSLVRSIRIRLNTGSSAVNNVYKEIVDAVDTLSSKNRELESKYKLVLPYMENYSLHDLLTNKNTDAKNYRSILKALGIQFIYTSYLIALIDFENTELTDEIVTKIKSFLYGYNEEFVFVLSKIKANRIALIINIDKDIDEVYPIFHKMKSAFNDENMELTISLGELCKDLDEISEKYKKVERQLENKFFTGTNEIIYASDRYVEGKNLFYDNNLEEDLLNHIRFANPEKARETLDKLAESILENVNSIDYIKYNFFRIISNIILVLSEFGIDSSVTGFTSSGIFEEIQNTSTIDNLWDFIDGFIEKSISYMAELKKTQHKEIMKRTMEYLESNYHRDITLEDVANAVYMSPRYLCGIFKAESGMTIFEYITKLRMDAALDLLKTGKKVQDIAQIIGYNNVQSFYRFFKKHYKMTPVQYRRKYLVNIPDDDIEDLAVAEMP